MCHFAALVQCRGLYCVKLVSYKAELRRKLQGKIGRLSRKNRHAAASRSEHLAPAAAASTSSPAVMGSRQPVPCPVRRHRQRPQLLSRRHRGGDHAAPASLYAPACPGLLLAPAAPVPLRCQHRLHRRPPCPCSTGTGVSGCSGVARRPGRRWQSRSSSRVLASLLRACRGPAPS